MDGIDTTTHTTAGKLATRSLEFLKEVKDLYGNVDRSSTIGSCADIHPARQAKLSRND